MKYHRFYKSAAQVLSSLDVHVDEAVEYSTAAKYLDLWRNAAKPHGRPRKRLEPIF